jgi:5-methylcytosine-specific restriction endonuclease McrA
LPSRPEIARLRKTSKYRNARARLLATSTVCWICGRDGADTADHVVPLNQGGDPYSALNLRPAHHRCNAMRKDNRASVNLAETSREW